MTPGRDPFEELVVALVEHARRKGVELAVEQARDLLWEAGVADLAEDLTVARAVIQAADGFHPVARFFVEGSPEREFIERTLRESP
jgi:hypothetical protein